jgi:hypothetical protein
VLEDVADLLGHQPGVDGDQRSACPRDAVVRFEQLTSIRSQERDALAAPDIVGLQRASELPGPFVQP